MSGLGTKIPSGGCSGEKQRKTMKFSWKLARRVALAAVLLFFIVIGKGAGVLIDFVLLVIIAVPFFGIKIYKHFTKRNAEIAAEANVAAFERAAQRRAEERSSGFRFPPTEGQ
jgi:hypothetical protein